VDRAAVHRELTAYAGERLGARDGLAGLGGGAGRERVALERFRVGRGQARAHGGNGTATRGTQARVLRVVPRGQEVVGLVPPRREVVVEVDRGVAPPHTP